MFGTMVVVSSAFLAVIARESLSAGLAGLSVSYALSITQVLNWAVRMRSELEIAVVSVERVTEYMQVQMEPARICPGDPKQALGHHKVR